jgi:hypothetical protein
MSLRYWFVIALMVCQTAGAQTPAKFLNPWVSAEQPGVPADPLELAVNAVPVQSVEQRAAAIKLLDNAQFLSNVRRVHYDLKTHFTSAQGAWQMEDSSQGRGNYRWTVQGPYYSAVNLFLDKVIYSDQAAGSIPLRVAQVHSAIFGHYPAYGPRAKLRLADGSLNGKAVTCVLVSHVFNAQPVSGARRWEEYESCIDPQSGLLMSYSPVPGMYVVYDYSNARHLGSVTFPGKFSIEEAGQMVVEAEVDSLTTPAETDAAQSVPAGLKALGVGFPLNPPWTVQDIDFSGAAMGQGTHGQVAVVRGMISADRKLTDAEVLASSDPALNQRALELAARKRWTPAADEENGSTPQAHEIFYTTLFLKN